MQVEERSFFGPRSIAALGTFAIAAVTWLVFLRSAPEPVETALPVIAVEKKPAPAEEGVTFFGGRILALPDAKWHVEGRSLLLESGEIEVDVLPATLVEVITAETVVQLVGSRVSVTRDAQGTRVRAVRIVRAAGAAGADGGKISVKQGVEVMSLEEERSVLVEPRAPKKRAVAKVVPEVVLPDPVVELKMAREVLERDSPRAAEIAERVSQRSVPAEVRVEALAVLADAERRRGSLLQAARSYAKVIDHPRGRGYAEEAMMQRALLYVELKDYSSALNELTRLEAQYTSGVSAPERAALAAKIYLERGDARAAAKVLLEAKFDGRSRVFELRRREVARVLEDSDAALANKLKVD
jgi:hypothetical protein